MHKIIFFPENMKKPGFYQLIKVGSGYYSKHRYFLFCLTKNMVIKRICKNEA